MIAVTWTQVFYLICTPKFLRAAGPGDEGVHIRQNTSAHVSYNCYVILPWPHCIYIDTCYIRLWFSNNSIQKLVGLYCGFEFNDQSVFMMQCFNKLCTTLNILGFVI